MTQGAPPPVDVFMPWYPRDWLTGQATFTMTNRQRGMFAQLLAHAWLSQPPATLPNHDAALAKYADEPLEVWRTDGAAVRAEWLTPGEMAVAGYDVPDDGRLRNPKQWETYLDAVERRRQASSRARNAAAGRWYRDRAGQQPGPAAPSGDGLFAEVIAPYQTLVAWVAGSESRERVLRRVLNRVHQLHGSDSLTGFVALANAALEGMPGHVARTAAEVESALEDWCDTDKQGTKNSLRNYLSASRPPRRPAPTSTAATAPAPRSKLTTE